MLDVAIDAGPLHGHRTGVGQAVAGIMPALQAHENLRLLPYVTSVRATVHEGERRLPLPAAVAQRLWARGAGAAMDRWLGRPDVVHGTNYVVPPSRCPAVVSVYDCWFLDHPDEAVPDVRRAAEILRRAVDAGAHVVTSSDATTERVTELLGTRHVTTVHLGPPDPTSPPTDPPARLREALTPFVLALGTIERRKNLTTLVAAFGRLAAERHEVRLVLAGAPGDDMDAVTTAIHRLDPPIQARIVRLGIVSDDERSWLLHHAAVLAYPSLDEGFGFPILEAQMAGTPVVGAAAGSIPEIGGTSVLLGPPRDHDALAANLHWMIDDSARRAHVVEEGRRNVERFSWAAAAATLADLYHELADT